jgi:hypothetical protein
MGRSKWLYSAFEVFIIKRHSWIRARRCDALSLTRLDRQGRGRCSKVAPRVCTLKRRILF